MKFQTLLLSGLLLSAPAFAQPQPQHHEHGSSTAPAPSTPAAEEAAERKICRSVQEDTGTRIGGRKKLCLTAAQWRRYDRSN